MLTLPFKLIQLKASKKKSALHEQGIVSQPEATSLSAIEKIKAQRAKKKSNKKLLDQLLNGNITALSQCFN